MAPLLDFTVQTGYLSEKNPHYSGFAGDKKKLSVISKAGTECQGIIPEAFPCGDASGDMAVYRCNS
ncbi:MAG: hypothetical protein ACI4UV_18875 [Victivallales bacterium]